MAFYIVFFYFLCVTLQLPILGIKMDKALTENRFKQVMIPAALMGVITNIGLAWLFSYIEAFDVILSPIICTVLFIVYFFLLKTDKLTSKQISLIVAYTVVIEIFIHSYCLGWGMGFYYYMFLLPLIFLLNSDWKNWMIVFFNSSIAVLSVLLWCFVYGKDSICPVPESVESYVNLFNLTASALVIIVIMIYFSRTINRKDEALIKANFELEEQNKEIIGQHKNLEILLKEIHHRVKNNLQIISSLMSLEHGNVKNEEVGIILNESRRRVEAIALIHHKLYQDKQFNKVDFKSYLEEIISAQEMMYPQVDCIVESPKAVLSLDIAVPLGLIISEMVTNSMKHAFVGIENPQLKMILSKSAEDNFDLTVQDNGVGLPDDFDVENPKSLGIEIITALTGQINGELECINNEVNGATFRLTFQDKLT